MIGVLEIKQKEVILLLNNTGRPHKISWGAGETVQQVIFLPCSGLIPSNSILSPKPYQEWSLSADTEVNPEYYYGWPCPKPREQTNKSKFSTTPSRLEDHVVLSYRLTVFHLLNHEC